MTINALSVRVEKNAAFVRLTAINENRLAGSAAR